MAYAVVRCPKCGKFFASKLGRRKRCPRCGYAVDLSRVRPVATFAVAEDAAEAVAALEGARREEPKLRSALEELLEKRGSRKH